MSFSPHKDPAPGDARAADAIDLVVVPRSVDLGHLAVRRALPARQAPHGRPLHLLRSLRSGGIQRRRRHRRPPASPYRPLDGHVPVRRRDHPSRQPRQRRADPSRRGELDDRRTRDRSFRAHRAGSPRRRRAICTACSSGSRCRRRRRRSRPVSRTTTPRASRRWTREGKIDPLIAGNLYGLRRRCRRCPRPSLPMRS